MLDNQIELSWKPIWNVNKLTICMQNWYSDASTNQKLEKYESVTESMG